ncbi:MAG TPA: YslB family protein [Bacillales bacterium]|nr:YslB family protein [Bacillales bacterium]
MDQTEAHDMTVPAFSYQLLRDTLIPELLGKDHAMIQYWAGKNLARQYPLETIEQTVEFFSKAGWGKLDVDTEGKTNITFTLSSALVTDRLKQHKNVPFTLESGFLAQQIQMMKNRFTDAQSSLKRGQNVAITVQWDPKDVVEEVGRRSRK